MSHYVSLCIKTSHSYTTLQIAKYPNQPMRYKIDTKNEWKTIRNHYYMVWWQKEKALKMNALLIKYDRCLWFV